ncbi:MAG: hypothetical protein P8P87_06885 [Crocinitomicaceae bacterium]|nr:hypothetical protein [Crocinitomicaceae bacterium]
MDFDELSGLSIILPTITGAIAYDKLNGALRKLSAIIFFTVTFQPLAYELGRNGINNMWLFHIHTWVETTILSLIFIEILNSWRRLFAQLTLVTFLLFSIYNLIKFEHIFEFNSNQHFVAGITLLLLILSFYFQLFVEAKVENLEKHPYFILNSSLLIYFAGTLFLFIFGKYAVMEYVPSDSANYWHLHSAFNIILNLGYTLTLWMGVKKLT